MQQRVALAAACTDRSSRETVGSVGDQSGSTESAPRPYGASSQSSTRSRNHRRVERSQKGRIRELKLLGDKSVNYRFDALVERVTNDAVTIDAKTPPPGHAYLCEKGRDAGGGRSSHRQDPYLPNSRARPGRQRRLRVVDQRGSETLHVCSAEQVVWSLGRTSAAARSRASGLSNPGATGVGSAAVMPFRGFADPTARLPDRNDATQQRHPSRKLTTRRRKFAG